MNAVNGNEKSHFGTIENPDGFGEHGSIACGDAMQFFFRVKKGETPVDDVIVEAKYSTFGCTSAIASSEALCEIIEKGEYTPIQALKIRNEDIVKYVKDAVLEATHVVIPLFRACARPKHYIGEWREIQSAYRHPRQRLFVGLQL